MCFSFKSIREKEMLTPWTAPVLKVLSPRVEDGQYSNPSRLASYTYTDISSSFFDKAKETFSSWRNLLDFKTLDIEKDVAAQGFEEGSFDLILCSNVLHATANLTLTLSNIHYLLKPGGKLLLQEVCSSQKISGPLAFRNLPG
jgi:SAM-dependent methyltransferase